MGSVPAVRACGACAAPFMVIGYELAIFLPPLALLVFFRGVISAPLAQGASVIAVLEAFVLLLVGVLWKRSSTASALVFDARVSDLLIEARAAQLKAEEKETNMNEAKASKAKAAERRHARLEARLEESDRAAAVASVALSEQFARDLASLRQRGKRHAKTANAKHAATELHQ